MNFRISLLSTIFILFLVFDFAAQTIQSTGVTAKKPAPADEILLPLPTGQYRVGRTSFHRTDTSRPETFTDDSSDHRQVLFQIWYPAETSGGTPAAYIDVSPDEDLFRRSYSFVGIERLVKTRSHALSNAQISNARKRYPVIIFSHGLGMVSALYSTFLENLASHGYIVVGVDSPFFSSALKLPDGRIIKNESRRNQAPGAREKEAEIQAQDLIYVLNELERLNKEDPENRFNGRLDLKHVGVFGHSRGGFAASHACLLDNRFKACLNLDGYPLTPSVMEKGIRQPYMHIEEIAPWEPPPTDEELIKANQTREQATKEAKDADQERETTFGKMSSGVYLVTVKGAIHNNFSDAPFISPDRYSGMTIKPERALTITNAYLLAFFDRHLRDQTQPLLKKVPQSFPEVTLKIYPPAKNDRTRYKDTNKS